MAGSLTPSSTTLRLSLKKLVGGHLLYTGHMRLQHYCCQMLLAIDASLCLDKHMHTLLCFDRHFNKYSVLDCTYAMKCLEFARPMLASTRHEL